MKLIFTAVADSKLGKSFISFIYKNDGSLQVNIFKDGFYISKQYIKHYDVSLTHHEIIEAELNTISNVNDYNVEYDLK